MHSVDISNIVVTSMEYLFAGKALSRSFGPCHFSWIARILCLICLRRKDLSLVFFLDSSWCLKVRAFEGQAQVAVMRCSLRRMRKLELWIEVEIYDASDRVCLSFLVMEGLQRFDHCIFRLERPEMEVCLLYAEGIESSILWMSRVARINFCGQNAYRPFPSTSTYILCCVMI